MILPYWSVDTESIKSSTGIERIHRPLVPLHLITAQDVAFVWALADTGADQTLLPASIANSIGIAHDDSSPTSVQGFGGRELTITFGTVDLILSGGDEQFQWSAEVGIVRFEKPEDEITILGHIGGLEFFRATFDGAKRQIELVPTASFPGTISHIQPTSQ